MNSDFLSLLVHPVSKSKLKYDIQTKQLIDEKSTDSFSIIEDVPVLLLLKENDQEFDYRKHYELDAHTYDYFADRDPVDQEENKRLHDHILSKIPTDAAWILDVGCGGAWLAGALCKKDRKVISMDISTINPVKALKTIPSPFHFALVADVFSLPFQENSLDCIIASEIIEHVPDPKRFLSALYKILKPGGVLIVTTPFNEKIQQSLCIHCNQLTPHNAHIHSFTENGIKSIAPQSALSLQTKTFNNKILVMLRIQKLLRRLPFSLWRFADQIANLIFRKKALRLMLVINK